MSKYQYFNGDKKHPYEFKACKGCQEESWIQKRRDFCSRRCSRMGEFNPAWKGDDATAASARVRAHRLYEVNGLCKCGKLAEHRHHINENTYDNSPTNIEMICASCHGKEHMTGNNYQVGEKHRNAKLTEEDVRTMRKRYSNGEKPKAIAVDYPIDPSGVSNIVAYRTWRHVN